MRVTINFLISNIRRVLNIVFFILGDSPASELYVPTFRNTVCSILVGGVSRILSTYTAYKDKTECSETPAYKIHKPGNHPKERIQHQLAWFCGTVLWPSRGAVRTFLRNTGNHVPINTERRNTGDNMTDKIMTAHSQFSKHVIAKNQLAPPAVPSINFTFNTSVETHSRQSEGVKVFREQLLIPPSREMDLCEKKSQQINHRRSRN
jgi:hypothetical protein